MYAVEERADGVYVRTPPAEPKRLKKHKPSHLLDEHQKPPGAPPRILGLSTTAMDDDLPRYSTSDALLEAAMTYASGELGADTQLVRLRQLDFRECEGNYSKAAQACTWQCAITERPDGSRLRGGRPLGRRDRARHPDPLGQGQLAVLQDGRTHRAGKLVAVADTPVTDDDVLGLVDSIRR